MCQNKHVNYFIWMNTLSVILQCIEIKCFFYDTVTFRRPLVSTTLQGRGENYPPPPPLSSPLTHSHSYYCPPPKKGAGVRLCPPSPSPFLKHLTSYMHTYLYRKCILVGYLYFCASFAFQVISLHLRSKSTFPRG